MSRELLKHPLFYQYSTIWMDEIKHPAGRITMISNTNKLIRQYAGCDGIKTGSTGEAGFCVSATASKGNTRLIAVILGSSTSAVRFDEAVKLLNYGFASYETEVLIEAGDVAAAGIPVSGGKETQIDGVVAGRVSVFVRKGASSNADYEIRLDENIVAPVAKGQKIGEVVVTLDGKEVGRTDIVSDRSVRQAGVWDYFRKIIACFAGGSR
jgi:D-alanyl-D-alanine carboxypeptidase (penicillin-binding protein 5/6)